MKNNDQNVKAFILIIMFFLFVLIFLVSSEAKDEEKNISKIENYKSVLSAFENQSLVRVTIKVKDTSGIAVKKEDTKLDRLVKESERKRIYDNNINSILSKLSLSDFSLLGRFQSGREFYGYINKDGLDKILNDSYVSDVYLSKVLYISLNESRYIINADDVENYGYTGNGQSVCVLDTGVDYNHTDLGGCIGVGCKVRAGWNYVGDNDNPMDDNGHGTHVAGIIASGNKTYRGIVPNASLIALKVCNSVGSCYSDYIESALDFCYFNSNIYDISVVSISIGDGGEYNEDCNNPNYANDEIELLYNIGIPVIIASGNDAHRNGISYPACAPHAISVGATDKGDAITDYTNRDNTPASPDLLAPGGVWGASTDTPPYLEIVSTFSQYIAGNASLCFLLNSPWSFGCNDGMANVSNSRFIRSVGTSMAAPHVSGASVLLLQKNSSLTPDDIKNVLWSEGVSLIDPDTGLTFKRINVLAAFNKVCGCGAWQYQGCGEGGCGNSETRYTRTCNGTSCTGAEAENCIYNSSCVGGGGGTTRYVCKLGCTYNTVQSALNNASNNDLIIINDSAIYSENINWPARDGITLNCKGASLSGVSGRGINLSNRDDNTIEYCNITGYGYGIFLISGSGYNKIKHNNITKNTNGIYLQDNAQPDNYIKYNNISGNTQNGVYFFGSSWSVSPSYNYIEDNEINNNYYGIHLVYGIGNKIRRNILSKHQNHAAIFFEFGGFNAVATISENSIYGNGGGIYFSEADTSTVSNNSFCISNTDYDFSLLDSTDNTGINNVCEKPNGWNDTGVIGCTYLCNYPPNVTLAVPANATLSYDGNVTFTCAAYDPDNYNLSNISLYHNIGGSWQLNQTKSLSGITDSGTFTVNNIPNGTYKWNCKAYDQDYYNSTIKSDWGDANYTFFVNITPLFTVSGLKEKYSNYKAKTFEFTIYNPRSTPIDNIAWILYTGDGNNVTNNTNITLSGLESIPVTVQYNYSLTGTYNVIANATLGGIGSSNNITINVTNDISVTEINDLNSYSSGLEKVFEFKIKNSANSSLSDINWSLDTGESILYAANLINLSIGEEAFVYIDYNYSSLANRLINATVFLQSGMIDSKIKRISYLNISNFEVLNSSYSKRIFGFNIKNPYFSNLTGIFWNMTMGDGNSINGTQSIYLIPNEEIFILTEHNYTSNGTFQVNATARNGTLIDSRNISVTV